MINGVSEDRYDYGYLRGYGWGTNGAGGTMYYGPPHSFWYSMITAGLAGLLLLSLSAGVFYLVS